MIGIILKKYHTIPIAAKASMWFIVCSLLQKGISFITTPIFTRLLTTEEFGVYNVFQSWYQILSVFMTLNLSYGVFNNAMSKFPQDRNRYISSMQGLVLVNSIVYVFIYYIFRKQINIFSGLSTSIFIMMFLLILSLPAQNYWMAKQRYEFKYKKLIIITLINSILTPVIGIGGIIFTSYHAEARIIGMVLSSIFIGGGIWIYNFSKGKIIYHKEYWRYSFKFNIVLIPHYLAQTILAQSDRIMINTFLGFSEAGIYSLAYSTAMILTILNTSINSSMIPWTYQKLKEQQYKKISEVANVIVSFITLIIIILICFAPEVIYIMGGSEYKEAMWAIPPIACSVYFMFLYNLFGNIEFYFEKNKYVMYASVGGAILNVLLNYIFIPRYGYLSAAYTTLFCYILFCVLHCVAMKMVCNEKINGEKIYNIPLIISLSCVLLVISLLITWIYEYTIIRYSLIIIIFGICSLKWKRIYSTIYSLLQKNRSYIK